MLSLWVFVTFETIKWEDMIFQVLHRRKVKFENDNWSPMIESIESEKSFYQFQFQIRSSVSIDNYCNHYQQQVLFSWWLQNSLPMKVTYSNERQWWSWRVKGICSSCSIPSTIVRQLTTVGNFSSRRNKALFWPLDTGTLMCTHLYTNWIN